MKSRECSLRKAGSPETSGPNPEIRKSSGRRPEIRKFSGCRPEIRKLPDDVRKSKNFPDQKFSDVKSTLSFELFIVYFKKNQENKLLKKK